MGRVHMPDTTTVKGFANLKGFERMYTMYGFTVVSISLVTCWVRTKRARGRHHDTASPAAQPGA